MKEWKRRSWGRCEVEMQRYRCGSSLARWNAKGEKL